MRYTAEGPCFRAAKREPGADLPWPAGVDAHAVAPNRRCIAAKSRREYLHHEKPVSRGGWSVEDEGIL